MAILFMLLFYTIMLFHAMAFKYVIKKIALFYRFIDYLIIETIVETTFHTVYLKFNFSGKRTDKYLLHNKLNLAWKGF